MPVPSALSHLRVPLAHASAVLALVDASQRLESLVVAGHLDGFIDEFQDVVERLMVRRPDYT